MKMEKTYQSERMTFEDSGSLQYSFQPRVGTHKLTVLCGSALSGRSKMTKVFIILYEVIFLHFYLVFGK